MIDGEVLKHEFHLAVVDVDTKPAECFSFSSLLG